MSDQKKENAQGAEYNAESMLEKNRLEGATEAMREMMQGDPGNQYIPNKNPTLPEGETPAGMKRVHGVEEL